MKMNLNAIPIAALVTTAAPICHAADTQSAEAISVSKVSDPKVQAEIAGQIKRANSAEQVTRDPEL